MNRETVFAKLQSVFADLLDEEDFVLKEEDTMDTIEDWDSLMHITLIASIEDEFGIRFKTEEIPQAHSVQVLMDIIMRELNH